jgi:hypothetical protein
MGRARGVNIEVAPQREIALLISQAGAKVLEWSEKKKQSAAQHFQELEKQAI